ncbi:hypothetical protein IM25_06480 [Rhodococcus sp. p52]|nr:hypothetical protein IM25_06480 [Rhodococcus sp. p52]
MAGYFGTEPTCARCDYPRRLHHLLGVEHDYTEPPNENAPDAGQGIEGSESANQEAGDSDMHSNRNRSNLTHLVSEWHIWVANQLDVEVPAFCGVTDRNWDVTTPDAGHETNGSAPAEMCEHCLEITDALRRARAEREADTDHVLVWDEGKIRAAADVREAL